jgi:hypothetical protein
MVEVRGQSPGTNREWYEPRRGRFATVVGVAFRRETYRHAAYLLLALPLGALYFALLAMAFSLGGGLAIALVGLVLLVGAMFAWPVVAEMERRLSNHMLRTRIDPLTFNEPDGPGLWPQIVARLTSVSTWQSLLYIATRLPLGIVAFVLAVVSLALALVTATMSLHMVNAMARLVARINTVLLQPWAEPAIAHAEAYSGAASPPRRPSPGTPVAEREQEIAPAVAVASPAGEVAPPMPAPGVTPPFSERAQRAAASFTDKVQEIADELSERARAAASAWNKANPGEERQTEPAPVADHGPTTTAGMAAPGETTPAPPDQSAALQTYEDAGPSRVTVDVSMRVVTVNEQAVELTPKEFDLIVLFVSNPGRPFSRDELLDRIWRNDYEVTDRTIDTHIQRLRKKIGPAAELIQTVWGVGYKYQPPKE